jgi:prophage maintenance system killer protein
MEATLLLNGHELAATIDDAEEIILAVAAGRASREALTEWVRTHIEPASS